MEECSSFLYLGPKFIHESVVLPEYLSARDTLYYDYIKPKLPQTMADNISFDAEQFEQVFTKASQSSSSAQFVKCSDVWIYAPSLTCWLSDVRTNELIDWGITPVMGQPIRLQPCRKPEHGHHDHLAPFQFTNPELLAFYETINAGHDCERKRAIVERYNTLQHISSDPSYGHENTCFHCTGHPINHTNYKELDWTTRLFYSIKDHLDADVRVKPSYSYASNYNFPCLQHQISSCLASNVYHFKGAPDLLFIKKKVTDASLLVSDDDGEGYLSMPKNTITNFPNVSGQVFAGLHFLAVAKTLKHVINLKEVPQQVKSKGILMKRKDAMWLYTLTVDINKAGLASTKASVQDVYMLDNFTPAHLCAGIMELFKEGFPLHQGAAIQRTYEITPLLSENRNKRGLALDGQIKHGDTYLASSSIFPHGDDESKETRERAGIIVHYNVKIRCIVSFGSDLTMELPFILTHPEPEHKVICGMVTIPRRKSTIKYADQQAPVDDNTNQQTDDNTKQQTDDTTTADATGIPVSTLEEKAFDTSFHGVVDHNLITFDVDGGMDEDTDFVFEEFVWLRVAGADDNTETDA